MVPTGDHSVSDADSLKPMPLPWEAGSGSDFGQGDVRKKSARRLWEKSFSFQKAAFESIIANFTNDESHTFVGEHLSKFYSIYYSGN